MDSLVTWISQLLGTYVPSTGGIASVDFPWLVAAAWFLLASWFLFKLILRCIGGNR